MTLILASTSPRRQELLHNLGVEFEIVVKNVSEEISPLISASETVKLLAERKAMAVANERNQGLVIGADTVVVYQGEIMGKPKNDQEAKKMLRKLQGKSHEVFTGVAVIDAATKKSVITSEITKVTFKNMSDKEIEDYVLTGEPLDKAGSYGVQGKGALFIKEINGCYFNVVGLPLAKLSDVLKEFKYNILTGE